MKDKIIIIGAGEHARVVIDNIEEQGLYEIFGLTTSLDDELGKKVFNYEIICKDEQVEQLVSENEDIVGYFLGIGIRTGNMKLRYNTYSVFDKILNPINIIHPTAIISKHSKMGIGNIIEAYTKVANGALIGNHCIINSFSAVNHDQCIGNNVLIAGNVSMAGTSIGDHTIIADGVSISFKKKVGKNCIIGDGATVTKDIPDNVVAFGNPARIVRENIW